MNMVKRIKHAIFGHTFKWKSSTYCPGNSMSPFGCTEAAFCVAWGFTLIVQYCDCGKVQKIRLVGKHGTDKPSSDAELQALRKMAEL